MQTAQAWTNYWEAGATDSCFAGSTPIDARAFWQPVMDRLPEGVAVLDAACGGGALVQQLLASERGFRITGVDVAERLPSIEGATLIPNCDLNKLPLGDGQFGAAVSQFGIEYSDWKTSIGEVMRVLGSGGVLALLMHHASGAVVAQAAEQRDAIVDLTTKGELLINAVVLSEIRKQGVPTGPQEAKVAALFKAATERPMNDTRRWALNFVAEVMENQATRPPGYLSENINRLAIELDGFYARMTSMVEAALSPEAFQTFVGLVEQHGGSDVQANVMADDAGNPVGWTLQATKA